MCETWGVGLLGDIEWNPADLEADTLSHVTSSRAPDDSGRSCVDGCRASTLPVHRRRRACSRCRVCSRRVMWIIKQHTGGLALSSCRRVLPRTCRLCLAVFHYCSQTTQMLNTKYSHHVINRAGQGERWNTFSSLLACLYTVLRYVSFSQMRFFLKHKTVNTILSGPWVIVSWRASTHDGLKRIPW